MISLKFGNQSRLQLLSNCLRIYRNVPQELRDEHRQLSRLRTNAAKSKLSRVLAGCERFIEQQRGQEAVRKLRTASGKHKLDKILAKSREERAKKWLAENRRGKQHAAPPRHKWRHYVSEAPPDMREHVGDLYEAWHDFNQRFFDGKLLVPKISIEDLSELSAMGCCGRDGKTTFIKLERSYFVFKGAKPGNEVFYDSPHYSNPSTFGYESEHTRKTYGRTKAEAWKKCCVTLLHEMGHQSLKESKRCDGHGERYTAIVNRIGKMLGVPAHRPTYDHERQSKNWPLVADEKLPVLFPLAQTAAAA